ncbi:GNAT family N-acetyltransferase [Halomarina rubra]|uniref:GNAT family N-acetyltransferase n=1 Tax=Halomarina rubra TaxID=2071873 RepID=A0ABD6AWX4_9EURY|nr:GNAT family N-acetyltransferase [Halomarina rubra]
MNVVRLVSEEAAVRRYLEELWLPYNREFEMLLDDFALAEDVDIVAEELAFRVDRLESAGRRTWVAVDGAPGDVDLATTDGELVGFVAATLDEAPSVFDRPDRLLVTDIYVRESYRGTDIARELVERARTWAREVGCDELTLDVDVGNDRAIAFYEKLGFETRQYSMTSNVDG